MSKILAQSIFSIKSPYNGTRIHASNVSSFNQILRSLFTQLCLENPCSHIVVFSKPKLQSWNCRSYWNLEVSIRVPRLELYFYLQIAAIVFCDMQFLEMPSLWLMETLQSTFLWSAIIYIYIYILRWHPNGIWQVLKTSILNTDDNVLILSTSFWAILSWPKQIYQILVLHFILFQISCAAVLGPLWQTFVSGLKVYERAFVQGMEESSAGTADSDGTDHSLESLLYRSN